MKTIQTLIQFAYQKFGNEPFLYQKKQEEFESYTYKKVIQDILALSETFLSYHLADKYVIIYGRNSYEWLISWTSIIGYVGVAIPVDDTWTSFNLEQILKKIPVDCILYTGHEKEIEELKKRYSKIQYYELEKEIPAMIVSGREKLTRKKELFAFEKVGENETCELEVKSAFSTNMKIVTHTQKNLLANLEEFQERLPFGTEDLAYLYLSMAYSFTSVYLYLYAFASGMKLYLGDYEHLREDLVKVKPTVFFGVPKVYQKIMEGLTTKERNKLRYQIKKISMLEKFGILTHRERVFSKLHQRLFGRTPNYLICSGGTLKNQLKKEYQDVGLLIQEMYGISETCSLISLEQKEFKNIYSQGVVLKKQEIKIEPLQGTKYGEILVKGDAVFSCYYNNVEETSMVFDKEGFFHTGRIGYLKENKELFVIGNRNQEVTLDCGKNVVFSEIESLLYHTQKMDSAHVFEKNGIIRANIVTGIEEKQVKDTIEEINQMLPSYMRLQDYHIKKRRE